MSNKEEMLNDFTGRTVFPLIGAALLGSAIQLSEAQGGSPAVRSEMLVSTTWLEQHLDDRNLIVLQIGRDRGQFDAGQIPGSRFLRLDDLVEQRPDSLNELPSVADLRETLEGVGVGEQSRVVLMDDSGGVLAARAYFTLDYLGLGDHAALLNGGLAAWIAESKRLSKEPAKVTRGVFVPHIHGEILISTSQMRRLSAAADQGSREYVLLDARPVAEHTGVVESEAVLEAGHIEGSRSLYWKRLVDAGGNSRLLDAYQMFREFEDAGAAPGKAVVTYCRTGMQSSFTYFVAKYLGYRAAMYDGSVYEWVRTPGNRLVKSEMPESAIPAQR
jgi:thiosulfate/3-mercaptopyruvate sulfurtransferase